MVVQRGGACAEARVDAGHVGGIGPASAPSRSGSRRCRVLHRAAPSWTKARGALKRHFGYDDFRPGQCVLVEAVLSGRDALGVMPTRRGQVDVLSDPGIVLPGLALVSPLVSLMGDQVRSLLEAGVRGRF